MSLRPRTEKKPEAGQHGSLFAPAIKLKPGLPLQIAGLLPKPPLEAQEDIGLGLIDDSSPNANMTINFYCGPVNDDTDAAYIKRDHDLFWLRFKIMLVDSRSDRRNIAKLISKRVLPILQTGMYDPEPYEDDQYVCGNPRASSYIVAFFNRGPVRDKLEYVPILFEEIARAIAIKDPKSDSQKAFKIDLDGFNYNYHITNIHEESGMHGMKWETSMVVTRNPIHP